MTIKCYKSIKEKEVLQSDIRIHCYNMYKK